MTPDKVQQLLTLWERRFGSAWIDAMKVLRDEHTLTVLTGFMERGDIQGALSAMDVAMTDYFAAWSSAFSGTASEAALTLQQALGISIRYDGTNFKALDELRQHKLRLVTNFTTEQRLATQQAVERAFTSGKNPRGVAREFRRSIGLTSSQERAVANYRHLLERGSSQALQRQLRDRRFDPTVRRSGAAGYASE